MATPEIVAEPVLTLRCGHPYRRGLCRRAIGWVGRDRRDGDLAVELLTRSIAPLLLGDEWFPLGGGEPVDRRWRVHPILVRLTDLRADYGDYGTTGVRADCDRHGARRYAIAAIDTALQTLSRDLLGV